MDDHFYFSDDPCAYEETVKKLLSLNTNPKFGLSRIGELLGLLGLNQSIAKVIQIVGTNGKGSTSAFIESISLSHAFKTGLFTSPHLCSVRERIRIDGKLISEQDFVLAAQSVLKTILEMSEEPSFFECMLAIALLVFKEQGVNIIILEAGLGGRLDATTAVTRDVIGISSIDLDHQNILGSSIGAIALEKISAAKKEHKVVVAKQDEEVSLLIKQVQQDIGFELLMAKPSLWPLGLFGEHQKHNAGLAIACLKALSLPWQEQKIKDGLKNVNWPGRFEIISQAPPVILDGAHNPSGLKALIKAINEHPLFEGRSLALVFGSMVSVNTGEKIALLKNLPLKTIYIHEPNNSRAEKNEDLINYFINEGFEKNSLQVFSSWPAVLQNTKEHGHALLICGSLYTVGEARAVILGIKEDIIKPKH